MSKSVFESRCEQLEQQLAASLSDNNVIKDSLKAANANYDKKLAELAQMTKQRDDARDAVSSLKELLHNAEMAAARVNGHLDRVVEIERRAAVPMETRTVSVPFEGRGGGYMAGESFVGQLRSRDGEKHWTSL